MLGRAGRQTRIERAVDKRGLAVHADPLSNVVPAPVIALISLAYLEEDGVLLAVALAAEGWA